MVVELTCNNRTVFDYCTIGLAQKHLAKQNEDDTSEDKDVDENEQRNKKPMSISQVHRTLFHHSLPIISAPE